MITFFFAMGAQGWVPLPLCCPADAPFLDVVCLSLEILIFVGFFTIATSSSLVVASLALLVTSCSGINLLLVVAVERFSKYPLIDSMLTSSPLLSVAPLLLLRTLSAAFTAPNLSAPSAACDLTRALVCALL